MRKKSILAGLMIKHSKLHLSRALVSALALVPVYLRALIGNLCSIHFRLTSPVLESRRLASGSSAALASCHSIHEPSAWHQAQACERFA